LSTPANALSVDLSLDWRVLGFTAAIAVATALLFGVAPAWRAGRADPNDALKQQGRSVAGHRRRPLGHPLVVVQIALSLVLVFGAGLFMRTFSALATLDLGFDRDPVLLVSVDAQRTGLRGEHLLPLYERLHEAAAAVPGVSRAGLSAITPISGMAWNNIFEFPGGSQLPERERLADVNAISPGYFATFGTRLLRGRDFSAADRRNTPGVVIVNEAFARKFFPGESPIGKALQQAARPDFPTSQLEIVGVVRDAAYRSVRAPMPPTVYLPFAQLDGRETFPMVNVSVRSAAGPPSRLVQSLADALGGVDRNLSMTFRPMADQVNASLVRERILAMLGGFFGALSLLLAGIGLYGVTSYSVSQRRTEIGVRMALGADAGGVVRLLLRQVAVVVLAGVAAGTLLSLWASRYAESLLYGLGPSDVPTLTGAAVVLAAIAGLAAWVPARRAARIDPAEVLREG
jgi:predicted permease